MLGPFPVPGGGAATMLISFVACASAYTAPGRPSPPVVATTPFHTAPRATPPRLELGLQVDPLATSSSVFVLGGFALLQLKIRDAQARRVERDAAVETLRKAEILLLAGKLKTEDVERALDEARAAIKTHDDARRIAVLPGALLRLPDPTATQTARVMEQVSAALSDDPRAPPPPPPSPAPPAPSPAARDELDGVRAALGLRNPEAPDLSSDSLLPTGSRSLTLKDVAIGIALFFQICWFLVSLTDPMVTRLT
jgi:hypothetical protein